jgi:hypothetical protein
MRSPSSLAALGGALLAALIGAALPLSPASAQSSYRLVDLGAGSPTNSNALNGVNHVVFNAGGQARLWIDANSDGIAQASEKTALGCLVPGGTSEASAINDADEVAGTTDVDRTSVTWPTLLPNGNAGPSRCAFLWAAGSMRNLNDLNGDGLGDVADWMFVGVSAINNGRQVAGVGIHWNGSTWTGGHGFLYDLNAGTVVLVQLTAGSTSSGTGSLNQSGQLIFSDSAAGAKQACFYNGGAVSPLDVYYAYGLSEDGRIVGGTANAPGFVGSIVRAFYKLSPTASPQNLGPWAGLRAPPMG